MSTYNKQQKGEIKKRRRSSAVAAARTDTLHSYFSTTVQLLFESRLLHPMMMGIPPVSYPDIVTKRIETSKSRSKNDIK